MREDDADANIHGPGDVNYSTVSSYLNFSDGLTITTNSTQELYPYFTETLSDLSLSHYGVLYTWNNNQPTSGYIVIGSSINSGVPGAELGQVISNTTIQFAPSSFTVPQPSGYYNVYQWMSNQTLDSASGV